MNSRSVRSFAPFFILITFAFVTPALGQTPPDEANRWEFTIAPYLVLPHMNGQTTVRGNPVDVDVGPSEIFERLDFAAMLYLEMANRDWAITLDGLYMNLGERGKTPITERDAEVDMKQGGFTATGMWRAASWAEIGIGARLNVIKSGLFIAPGEVLPGRDVEDTNTWFDPLIVARLTAPESLDSRWRVGIYGDVGGLGIGSDFAWQVFPSIGYRFGRLFELTAGYRALGMNYETGSGDDLFLYDMVIFGPQIGLVFHF